jgi:nicotinamide-nucleotide amidase
VPRAASATDVVSLLASRGLTVATGESITAGLVSGRLADVPGCSAVLRGGIVAYQADVKTALLSVDAEVVARGIVSEAVATAMAIGACRALGADIGIGTTGVAGPDPHDGEPVGSVWIAVASDSGGMAEHLALQGTRAEIRHDAVQACWSLVVRFLGDAGVGVPRGE